MKGVLKQLCAALLLATSAVAAQASSHREALAVLNEPCADNTDTYAWVSPGTHDKLYLIMNFNPLHEPGQGNQGLRACNGYRYEFHIGEREQPRRPRDLSRRVQEHAQARSGAECQRPARRRQRAALAAHWRHRNDEGHADRRSTRRDGGPERRSQLLGSEPAGPSQQSRPADRSARLRPRTVRRIRFRRRHEPRNRPLRSVVRGHLHPYAANGGRIIAGQFDDPYQLDEKGIFDLVNLNRNDLGGIAGARRPPARMCSPGFNVFSIALEIPITDIFPDGIPHNGQLRPNSTDSLLRVHSSISRRATQTVDPEQYHHRPRGLRPTRAGRAQRAAALQRRPRRHAAPHAVPAQQPDEGRHATSERTFCSRCSCATPMRSASTRLSAYRRRR